MPLPLPHDELPERIRRFAAPGAAVAAKTMAARGLVPVKGEELVTLLVALGDDADEGVSSAAQKSLAGLPESVLAAACSAALHPAILERLVPHVRDKSPLLEELVANRATPDEVLVSVAKWCDERTGERIATDQARLLEAPAIIESLYKNKHTRMSTVDRLVELAARNGVELTGIATFKAHVEAIQGQLVPDEPTDEPLPSDALFSAALAEDDDDDPIVRDKVDGSEEIKPRHAPLALKIQDMSVAERVRLTLVGNAAARQILVRDSNRMVAMAAIGSPSMSDAEAARVAISKQVSEDILRYIGNRRDWLGNYEVKKNLIFNPKTPMGVSMNFLSHLRVSDLRALSRSKNVPAALRTAATQRVEKKAR